MYKPNLTVGFVLTCLLGSSSQDSCLKVSLDPNSTPDLTGTVLFQFSAPVSAWTLVLRFDKRIQELVFPEGVVSRKGRVVTINSTEDNGHQPQGVDIMTNFTIKYKNQKPRVVSAKLKVEMQNNVTDAETSTPVTTTATTITAMCGANVTTKISVPAMYSSKPFKPSTKYDYDQAIHFSNLFYQAQRSGDLDAFGDFNHLMIPYRGNSAMDDGSDNSVDLVGGYYDGKKF